MKFQYHGTKQKDIGIILKIFLGNETIFDYEILAHGDSLPTPTFEDELIEILNKGP